MSNSDLDPQREAGRVSSTLKLKGLHLRALNIDSWPAVLCFHEAAQIERDIFDRSADDLVRFGSAIEACGLFLDSRDPVSAITMWRVLTRIRPITPLSDDSPREHDIPDKLQRLVEATHATFRRDWDLFKSSMRSFERFNTADLDVLCGRYPGVASFWWMYYRYYEARGEFRQARAALTRAMQLEPSNARYIAMWILLSKELEVPVRAKEMSRHYWEQFRQTSAEVNHTYALALLQTSGAIKQPADLRDLDEATTQATRLARRTPLEPQTRMLRSYVEILLARKPTPSDFERLGVKLPENQRPSTTRYERALIAACLPENDNRFPEELLAA